MKSRQAYWSAKEYLMWEFLIGGRRNFKSSSKKDKGWSFQFKHHFLIQVLQYPGNEIKFRSDRNWGWLMGKISSPLSAGSILWFWWHVQFSALPDSDHAQKPFFTSNEPNIFALPPSICMRGSFDKMQSAILEPEDAIGGHLYSWERETNPPIQQFSSQSFISISFLCFFPICWQPVTKSPKRIKGKKLIA